MKRHRTQIVISLGEDESADLLKDRLQKVADSQGMTLSEWVRLKLMVGLVQDEIRISKR